MMMTMMMVATSTMKLGPEEQVGVGEQSVAVDDERVEQSVVALSDARVEHEVDRVILTDRVIVVGHRELNQPRATHPAATSETVNQYFLAILHGQI